MSNQYYATQLAVLDSREVAVRAIHQINWQRFPEYWKKNSDGDTTLPGPQMADDNVRFSRVLLDDFIRRSSVEALYPTKIVKVHFDSMDPELSMIAVNAIVDAYLSKLHDDHQAAQIGISQWLAKRIEITKLVLSNKIERFRQFLESEEGRGLSFSRAELEQQIIDLRVSMLESNPGVINPFDTKKEVLPQSRLIGELEKRLVFYDAINVKYAVLKADVEASRDLFLTLKQRQLKLEAVKEFPSIRVQVMDRALLPNTSPYWPKLKIIELAVWGGILIGGIISLIRHRAERESLRSAMETNAPL